MVRIEYIINKNDDLSIWLKFINSPVTYGLNRLDNYSDKFKKEILNQNKNIQRKNLSKHIEKYYTTSNLDKFRIKSKNKIKKNKTTIIKRLEKIHNKKMPVNLIKIKYTTFNVCPYIFIGKKPNWFGLYFSKEVIDLNLEINVFIHEMMHLFFHYYFWDKYKISAEQKHDIKEAFTIIIDEEFKDIISIKDRGYKKHTNLRKYILKEWKKGLSFEKILKNIILEKKYS